MNRKNLCFLIVLIGVNSCISVQNTSMITAGERIRDYELNWKKEGRDYIKLELLFNRLGFKYLISPVDSGNLMILRTLDVGYDEKLFVRNVEFVNYFRQYISSVTSDSINDYGALSFNPDVECVTIYNSSNGFKREFCFTYGEYSDFYLNTIGAIRSYLIEVEALLPRPGRDESKTIKVFYK